MLNVKHLILNYLLVNYRNEEENGGLHKCTAKKQKSIRILLRNVYTCLCCVHNCYLNILKCRCITQNYACLDDYNNIE